METPKPVQPETTCTPKISVIMPAYNAERTIGASINSIASQSFLDWELIIVNDCSTDGTAAIVNERAAKDPRIHVCHAKKNQGIAATRNLALELAQGEWVAFLDSDDLWHEEKLDKQLRFLEESVAVISYTATAYMDEDGRMSGYVLPAVEKLSYKTLMRRNIMSCSSVMVHRDVMIPFPLAANTHEDYVVWLKIVRDVGCAVGLDEPLLVYRVSKGSISAGRRRSAVMTYNAYRQVGYGGFMSFVLMLRYSFHSITKRFLIRRG